MIEFKDSDFALYRNLANPNKAYYYAEKELNSHTVEVHTSQFKINYKVEIKTKNQNTIATGNYKSIEKLNLDLDEFISLNAL